MYDYDGEFRFVSKYKLNVCALPKSMSTVLTGVMCLLYDPEEFLKEGRTINTDNWDIRFCKKKNEASSIEQIKNRNDTGYKTDSEKWKHVLIVREPMERFISGFLDRCVLHEFWREKAFLCFGCKTNLTCLLENLDKTMSDPKLRIHSVDTYHFFPQNWWCQMGINIFDKFTILKVSRENTNEFWQKFYSILRNQSVPNELVELVDKQVHSGETSHTTFHQKDLRKKIFEELQEPYHMNLFIKAFYYDYVLFGFPLPNVRYSLAGSKTCQNTSLSK
ncbi:hypothetical protein FO519_007084 [Halicephalobus sp. NKZ332]|nr:hypothetical protein FO519_007084 [Halicephalobus sp. NKZ332]